MAWMIIRVRGTIHAKEQIRATLQELHLSRPNHATVVPEVPDFRGMITRVQGYVTWGEAEPDTVQALVASRGERPTGGKIGSGPEADPPTELEKVAAQIMERGLPRTGKLKPLFRLHAPKGGWRSTKKPFALGGALGYRGKAINELARRML